MDRNTITGLVLIFLIFIGFSVFNNSRMNKAYKNAVVVADSLYKKGELEKAKIEYLNALKFKPNQPEVLAKLNEVDKKLGIVNPAQKTDTIKTVTNAQTGSVQTPAVIQNGNLPDSLRFGVFAKSASGENDFITLENDKVELKISTKGGRLYSARLKDYKTYDSLPLFLFDGDSTVFGLNFFTSDNKAIQTNELYFKTVDSLKHYVADKDPVSVSLRLKADEQRYLEYTYTLSPGKYVVGLNVKFVSLGDIIAANQSSMTLDWRMYVPKKEKGKQSEEYQTTLKYKYFQDEVDGFRERSNKENEEADVTTKMTWVAYKDQFFSAVLINDDYFQSGSFKVTRLPASTRYLKYFTTEAGVPYNASNPQPVNLKFYLGPNHFTTLKREGYDLEQLVTLGKNITRWINQWVIIPIFNWLNKYIGNYGLIILILTIIIKIVLFPLTFKSYQSQAKMQVLKPLVDELGKKFPKKEDALKKQQATMDLYKRAGVNPMGGCLPMLLQMPILFAMFRFFPSSIELRQEPFLWATDLSTYDSILTLPFTIPLYGNHVSLFTLLMTASTLLTMKMTGSQPGSDQPGMKVMMYMMPIMFMLILNNFSSGLTYYYFLANMLTYIQNVISKRFIDADKVLATLEENKKKPLQKSKWQQRLEDAAKKRGYTPPRN
ncbi:MAG: membrane protein insertase YidC [Bacteroidales bacterium]